MFGPAVPPRGVMSAKAEAAIPKAKNGSINADELNRPQKLTELGLSKRPRPKKVKNETPPERPRKLVMSAGISEDTMPFTEAIGEAVIGETVIGETMPVPSSAVTSKAVVEPAPGSVAWVLRDEDEDMSLTAAIEAMVRKVEERIKPNESENPAAFALREQEAEAVRMGKYSQEAEDDAADKELQVEAYYAEECFPVRSVMGFVTRNWRVPLNECELAFVVNGHWWRKTKFDTLDKLERFISSHRPSRIEIGGIRASTERFLVFDADLEDAPETHVLVQGQLQGYIRNCKCKGTRNVCSTGCWFYMVAAIKCLTYIAVNVFGAKHVLPVFSGRRGVHIWVLDEKFVRKTQDEREAIVARIQAFSRPHETNHPEYTPYLREYILEPIFYKHVLAVSEKGSLLSCHETIELVSRIVTEMRFSKEKGEQFYQSEDQKFILDAMCLAATKPVEAWESMVARFGPVFRSRVIFAMLFPRLDTNVTTQMNHCVKAPFVIHPDTRRCSIPIPNVDTWTPDRAPRLSHFVTPPSRRTNAYGNWRERDNDESPDAKANLSQYIAHMTHMVEKAYPFVDNFPNVYRP